MEALDIPKPKWQLVANKCKCKWQFTSASVSWQLPAIGEYLSAPFIRQGRITNKELNTANQTGFY